MLGDDVCGSLNLLIGVGIRPGGFQLEPFGELAAAVCGDVTAGLAAAGGEGQGQETGQQ